MKRIRIIHKTEYVYHEPVQCLNRIARCCGRARATMCTSQVRASKYRRKPALRWLLEHLDGNSGRRHHVCRTIRTE